ncbi:MAG: hypothetical protein GWN47_09365 [Woeseiaceae bacterium]|nr:hypothetical protein [Woeseiaceae bacterium]
MVITVADVPKKCIESLLGRYGLNLVHEPSGAAITGSFWGDEEAGIVGLDVFARDDTPVHSLLHEACHSICMTSERRARLHRDAGGDDLEEAAVCYLQILLADELDGVGRDRLMRDMDTWGYSFRLGSAQRWFADDADDACNWLIKRGLISQAGEPTFRLRR